ncbi:MAG: hypothetical protein AAF828_00320 [Bacteroidota bacterium]
MEHPAKDRQLLDDYLAGQLDPAAVTAVEDRLETDPDFARLLSIYRIEQAALEAALTDHIRTKIDGWEDDPPPPLPARGISRWWLLLAIVPLFIMIDWWYLSPDPAPVTRPEQRTVPASPPEEVDTPATRTVPPPPAIAQESSKNTQSTLQNRKPELTALATNAYRLPDQITMRLRSEETSSDTTAFYRGIAFFKAADYAAALAQFRLVKPEQDVRNWQAHSLFQLKRYAEASLLFQEMTQTSRGAARDRAEWYQALSRLAAGQEEEATALLEKMEELGNKHNFGEPARKLLDSLP